MRRGEDARKRRREEESTVKVLVLNGSPRPEGNTSRLISIILDAAKDAAGKSGSGVEVHNVRLNDLSFKGCQGCMKCKKETAKGCEQVDDLTPVLQMMGDSDAWIVGTPIYMGHMSGQLKLCIDRMYGFSGPNRTMRVPPGKKAVIAMTQGMQDANAYKSVSDMLAYMLSRRGFTIETVVSGGGSSALPGSGFSKEVEGKAKAAGAWLAGVN
jgi:multimeric flavodoxin WrbA